MHFLFLFLVNWPSKFLARLFKIVCEFFPLLLLPTLFVQRDQKATTRNRPHWRHFFSLKRFIFDFLDRHFWPIGREIPIKNSRNSVIKMKFLLHHHSRMLIWDEIPRDAGYHTAAHSLPGPPWWRLTKAWLKLFPL